MGRSGNPAIEQGPERENYCATLMFRESWSAQPPLVCYPNCDCYPELCDFLVRYPARLLCYPKVSRFVFSYLWAPRVMNVPPVTQGTPLPNPGPYGGAMVHQGCPHVSQPGHLLKRAESDTMSPKPYHTVPYSTIQTVAQDVSLEGCLCQHDAHGIGMPWHWHTMALACPCNTV